MPGKDGTLCSHSHRLPGSDGSCRADLGGQRMERGVKKLRYPLDDYLLNSPEAANQLDVLLHPTSPECHSETVDVLQNAEKLVNEARQQITELTCNVVADSFVENSDKYSHPAIDDNLLYVRRIVESKFRESNDAKKLKDDISVRAFDSTSRSCESYAAKGSNDIFTRPAAISARNAEPCETKADKDADSQRERPDNGKTGGRIDSPDSRRINTFGWTHKNVSVRPTLSKAAQKSESMTKVEPDRRVSDLPNPNFQVQFGPKMDIRGDLTIQKVEDVHIPPNSSAAPIYKNVATYNFWHESFASSGQVEPEHFVSADKVNDNRKVTRIRMSDREELISIRDVDDKNGVNKLTVDSSNLKRAVSPRQNSTNNCVSASVDSKMSPDRSNLIDNDAAKNWSGSRNTGETNNDTESSDHKDMIRSRNMNIVGDSAELASEKQTVPMRCDEEEDVSQREVTECQVQLARCTAKVCEDGDCSRRRERDIEYREKLNEALETITMIGKHRTNVEENDSPLKSSTQGHGATAATNDACENTDGLSDLECFGRILEKFCKLMTRPEDSRREEKRSKDVLGQQATTNKIGVKSSEGNICESTIDQLVETELSVLLSNLNDAFSTPVEDNHSLGEKLNTPERSDHQCLQKITRHTVTNFAARQYEGNLLAERECDSVFQQYSHPEVTLLNPEYDLENLVLTPPCMSDIDSVQKKYRESMVTLVRDTDRLSQLILRHNTTNGLTCTFDRGLPSVISNLSAHESTQNLPPPSATVLLDLPQNSISKPLEKMTTFGLEPPQKNTSLPLKNKSLFSDVEMSSNVGLKPQSSILTCDVENSSQSGKLKKNACSSITKTDILDAETSAHYGKPQSITNNSIADSTHIVTISKGESLESDNCRPPTTPTGIIVPGSLENNQIFVSTNDRSNQSSPNAGRKLDESENFEKLARKYRSFMTTFDGKSTKLNPQSILNIRDIETTDSIDDQIFKSGSTENIGLISSDLDPESMIENSTLPGEETNLQMLGKMIGSIQHSLSLSLPHQDVSLKELNDENKEYRNTVADQMVVEKDCTLVTDNRMKHDSCKDNLARQRAATSDESRSDAKVQSSTSVKVKNYGRNSESCATLSHGGKIKYVSTEDNDEVQTYSFCKQPTDETRSITNQEGVAKIVECKRLETSTRSSNKSVYSSKNENCTTFANPDAADHVSSGVKDPTASPCKQDNRLRNMEPKSDRIEPHKAQERLEKQSETNKCRQNYSSVISNFEKNGSEGNTDDDISFVIPHDVDDVVEAPNTSGVYKIRIDIRNKDPAEDTQVCTNVVTRDRYDSACCTRRADSKQMHRKSRYHDAQVSLNKNGKFSKRPNSLIDALIETQIQKDTNTTHSGASERTSTARESIKVGTTDRKKFNNRMLPPKLKENSKSFTKKADNQSKNSGRKTAEQNKINAKKSAERQKNSGKKTMDQAKNREKKGRLHSKNPSDNNKLSFNNGKRAVTRIVKKIDSKASDKANMNRFCSICKQVYGTCGCISCRKCPACTTMEKRVKVPFELKTHNKLFANLSRHDTKRGNAIPLTVLPKKPAFTVQISPPSFVSKTLEACTNTEIISCLCKGNSLMTNAGTSMDDDQFVSVATTKISNIETHMQSACREVEKNTINVRHVSFAESNVTNILGAPQILPSLSCFCENTLCMIKTTVPEATTHSESVTLDAMVAENIENNSYGGDKKGNLAKNEPSLMVDSQIEPDESVSLKQPSFDESQNLSGTNVVMCSNIFNKNEIVTLQLLKEPANMSDMTRMMSVEKKVANDKPNCICELQVEELVYCNGGAEESNEINETCIRVCMDRDDRVIQDSVYHEEVPATESTNHRSVSGVDTGTPLTQKNDSGCAKKNPISLYSNNAQLELSLATSLPKVSNASCCTECMKKDMDVGIADTMVDFCADPMDRLILCINDDECATVCCRNLLYNSDLQREQECSADCAKYRPLEQPANESAQIISMNRPHSVFVNQDLTPLPPIDNYWRDEGLSGSKEAAETRIRNKRVQYDDSPKHLYPAARNTNSSVAPNIVQDVVHDHSSSNSPSPKLCQAELLPPENLTASQLNEGYPLSHDSYSTLNARDSAEVKKQLHLAHQGSSASVKREDQFVEPNDGDKHAEIIKNYTNNLDDYRDKYKEILNRRRLKSNDKSSGPTKNSTSRPSNSQISELSQVQNPHTQVELVECNKSSLKLDPTNHQIIDYTDLLKTSKYTQAGISNIHEAGMKTSETITKPISNKTSGRPMIIGYSLSYTTLETERDKLHENQNTSSMKRSRRKPVNHSYATKYCTTPQIIEYFLGKRKLEDMEISYIDETDSLEECDTGRTSNAMFNFSTGNIMKSLELCMIHDNAEQILTSKIWNETGSIDSCGSACSRCWEHASSDTYSEGEINLPSSCSYSLGEVRMSESSSSSGGKSFRDHDGLRIYMTKSLLDSVQTTYSSPGQIRMDNQARETVFSSSIS